MTINAQEFKVEDQTEEQVKWWQQYKNWSLEEKRSFLQHGYKPGALFYDHYNALMNPNQKYFVPVQINVGVFGDPQCGKSSCINTLRTAIDNSKTLVRMAPVGTGSVIETKYFEPYPVTKYLTVWDSRGSPDFVSERQKIIDMMSGKGDIAMPERIKSVFPPEHNRLNLAIVVIGRDSNEEQLKKFAELIQIIREIEIDFKVLITKMDVYQVHNEKTKTIEEIFKILRVPTQKQLAVRNYVEPGLDDEGVRLEFTPDIKVNNQALDIMFEILEAAERNFKYVPKNATMMEIASKKTIEAKKWAIQNPMMVLIVVLFAVLVYLLIKK